MCSGCRSFATAVAAQLPSSARHLGLTLGVPPVPNSVLESLDRHASGRPVATIELSASGGAYSSAPQNPAPEWYWANRFGMSSPVGHSRKNVLVANTTELKKNTAQKPATALRFQSRADWPGQMAAAKKRPIGASTTRSKRQGN